MLRYIIVFLILSIISVGHMHANRITNLARAIGIGLYSVVLTTLGIDARSQKASGSTHKQNKNHSCTGFLATLKQQRKDFGTVLDQMDPYPRNFILCGVAMVPGKEPLTLKEYRVIENLVSKQKTNKPDMAHKQAIVQAVCTESYNTEQLILLLRELKEQLKNDAEIKKHFVARLE